MNFKRFVSLMLVIAISLSSSGIMFGADDGYFSEEFNSLNDWKVNSKNVTTSSGNATILNTGTGETLYLQKNMTTFPKNFVSEFSFGVESYAAASGLNMWNGSHRVYLEFLPGGFRYRNVEQGLTTVTYPLGNDMHTWHILCEDLNATIYIDGNYVTEFKLPTFGSDKLIQFWVKANDGQTGKIKVDYFKMRKYSTTEAQNIENGIIASNVEEELPPSLTDIEGSPYINEINTLYHLDIMEANGGKFLPQDTITRGEFTGIITTILGVPKPFVTTSYFRDVYPEHKFFYPINFCASAGIIQGNNGLFLPDKKISYGEAVKMLVCALGFQNNVEAKGGNIANYISLANGKNILKGVKNDGVFTREKVAKLVFNTLDVCIAENIITGLGQKQNKSDMTLMESTFRIIKAEGVVKSNDNTSLTKKSTLSEKQVIIDGTVYEDIGGISSKLLGQRVVYFYENDEGIQKLKYVYPHDKNNVVTITSDKICDTSNLKTLLFINDTDKEEKLSIDSNADYIYNNVADGNVQNSDMVPKLGQVTLVDNNNDSIFDVVFIENYENVLVKMTNKKDFSVDTQDSKNISFDSSIIEKTDFYKDGNLASFNSVRADDVLSIFMSRDNSYAKVIISRKSIDGKVTEISQDEEYIVIDNKKYSVGLLDDIRLNNSYTFHLDFNNKIVFTKFKQSDQLQYAYLISGNLNSGLLNEGQLKLLTADNQVNIFTLDEKVTVYNNDFPDKYKKMSAKEIFESGLIDNPRLIKFSQNNDKFIHALYVANDNTQNPSNRLENDLTMDFKMVDAPYRSNPKLFNSEYMLSDTTIVFVVPDVITSETTDLDYYVTKINMFANDTNYDVELYDCGKTNIANVVITKEKNMISYNDCFVFSKITNAIDKNGNQALKIYGYQNGNETNYLLASNVSTNGLKFGDILRLGISNKPAKKEVIRIDVLFSPQTYEGSGFMTPIVGNYRGGRVVAIYGTVVSKENDNFTHTEEGVKVYAHTSGSASYYLVDMKNQRISNSSISALKEATSISSQNGSKVFLLKNFDQLKSVVIFEK